MFSFCIKLYIYFYRYNPFKISLRILTRMGKKLFSYLNIWVLFWSITFFIHLSPNIQCCCFFPISGHHYLSVYTYKKKRLGRWLQLAYVDFLCSWVDCFFSQDITLTGRISGWMGKACQWIVIFRIHGPRTQSNQGFIPNMGTVRLFFLEPTASLETLALPRAT